MAETPKRPLKENTAPLQPPEGRNNGAEKQDRGKQTAQEKGKLQGITANLKKLRAHEPERGGVKEKRDDFSAREMFPDGIQEKDEKKEMIQKTEGEYRSQIKKTYETEKREITDALKDDPERDRLAGEKISLVQQEYLETYLSDLNIDPEKYKQEDLDQIMETLPEAYVQKMLDGSSPVGEKFGKLRQKIYEEASNQVQKKDGESAQDYQNRLNQKIMEIAGIPRENELIPTSDNFDSQEGFDAAMGEFRANNPGISVPEEFQTYSPKGEWSDAGVSEGGTKLDTGKGFKEWLESSPLMTSPWKGNIEEFMNKLGQDTSTDTPVLIANPSTRRAIFIHKGEWKEFSVIFGKNGFGDGKGETPIGKIARFHSAKIASGPDGDASLTGSSTVKGASLLSELGASQGGKWWHGVSPNRLNGGHTLGCVGLDPSLAIQFAQAVQASGNTGYGYVAQGGGH